MHQTCVLYPLLQYETSSYNSVQFRENVPDDHDNEQLLSAGKTTLLHRVEAQLCGVGKERFFLQTSAFGNAEAGGPRQMRLPMRNSPFPGLCGLLSRNVISLELRNNKLTCSVFIRARRLA